MRKWAFLLGGLIVWSLHFFVIYGVVSIFPGQRLAHGLTIAATVPALVVNAGLIWFAAKRRLVTPEGDLDSWITDVAAIGAALSFVAVLWQAMPAVMI